MLLLFSIKVAELPPVTTTCLSCPFINCVCASLPFGFAGGMWGLIVLVPDHCLSFYFSSISN